MYTSLGPSSLKFRIIKRRYSVIKEDVLLLSRYRKKHTDIGEVCRVIYKNQVSTKEHSPKSFTDLRITHTDYTGRKRYGLFWTL